MNVVLILVTVIVVVAYFAKILYEGMEGNTLNIFKLPKIKYKQFLSFYNINPDRWELCWNRVEKDYDEFRLPIISYIPYTIFRILEYKRKVEIDNAESIKNLIEDVKIELDQFKKNCK